ncbi:hypothetical protein CASFOL_002648 [Castilleja foliolosa]|uniref:RING-type domain-containing protein n=1 Tax=Castilleja foliolosa TaxID=1961234 RepID=A0ABD3EF27_9LAMI
MDDSCAVCAESLEWVAYGACGHKDVCSTCVARLRFICDDRRCCICKTESDVVFVTKALGDYTKTISDFSVLPSEVKEGRLGHYWYHEDTQAFFDDSDHYKMIKAMCRLSCSECDKMVDQSNDGSRRRAKFRNIEQLKGHLFHKHRLLMCSLCLEGRKIFICEQKLYTRSQLTQHTNTGDSEVDGTESERGGFMGHPIQNPGQYEYYKDYDDLEIHFRGKHFICEDEGCLAKKFMVFLSEAELKRHNALEHGGRMSRSMRSAALQIPTSFRYRRSSEQDNRRGRGLTFRQDPADSELSSAIQASLEKSSAPQSSNRGVPDHVEVTDIDFPPIESLSVTDSETSLRYRQAVSQSSISGKLGESSFPPLPVATVPNQQLNSIAAHKKSIAARLRHQSDKKVNNASSSSSSSPSWPTPTRTAILAKPVVNNPHAWPSINAVAGPVSTSGTSRSVAEAIHTRLQPVASSSFVSSLISSRSSGGTGRISHSSSAPNLSERKSLDALLSDFPPVSAAAQAHKPPTTTDQAFSKVEVHTANKTLVEKMRLALGFDEEKFNAFRDISGEYRQGLMDAETYISYVEQFGLSHLVPDMARLLPNAMKQEELMDAYNLNMAYIASRETGLSKGVKNHGKGSKKGKGKSAEMGSSSVKNNLADNVVKTVKELHSSYSQASEEEVEVLSKDGYRGSRGKSKVAVDDSVSGTNQNSTNQNLGNGDGKSKQRKKTSKFLRARLGDGSVEALLDLRNSDWDSDPGPNAMEGSLGGLNGSLPVRGVWKNSGGQRLLGASSKGVKK